MKNHKYRYGKRVLNWRTSILSFTVGLCAVLSHYGNMDNTYVSEKDVYMKPVVIDNPNDESIETKIRKHFPKNGTIMIAVAKAESEMNPNAIGYNCYYYQGKATTTPIKGGSKSCKVEDRHLAWSRDCGLLQLNTTKKECPVETIDEHLQRAASLSRQQGLEAWVTYQRGMHEKHLATN